MKKKTTESEFKRQIKEIFGTTDLKELRQISEIAESNRKTEESADRRRSGRKNSFTDPQLANILALQKQGVKIAEIARKYQVSRQTIYTQIKRAHQFNKDPDIKMRMYFMNRDYLCTRIDIDFLHEKIYIQNYTDQIILRAFGVIEHPGWNDFQYFLEDRCFPRTRDHAREILRDMEIPFYDPLMIIEKTDGYMEGDHQWILIIKKEEG